MLYFNSSSFREASLEQTLFNAKIRAKTLGVTRVTEITHLDKIGIPVFSSIRPTAHPDSLCVNAGKGLSVKEAEVGAYMECIEFTLSEYGKSENKIQLVPVHQIFRGGNSILDFCPPFGTTFSKNQKIPATIATDIITSEQFLVPADLVFQGIPQKYKIKSLFGSSSNGLSSGNTIKEASIHGILEIIERDIESFNVIDDCSALVLLDKIPDKLIDIIRKIETRGFNLYVRYTKNDFNLHHFAAFILEEEREDPIYICSGFGCHISFEIALSRAITEAAQGRLSFIHGGRDDLIERYNLFSSFSEIEEDQYLNKLVTKITNTSTAIKLSEIADLYRIPTFESIESVHSFLVRKLIDLSFDTILQVKFSTENDALSVIKTIIPKMEFFENSNKRVGKRLLEYAKNKI